MCSTQNRKKNLFEKIKCPVYISNFYLRFWNKNGIWSYFFDINYKIYFSGTVIKEPEPVGAGPFFMEPEPDPEPVW